jgi:hypothetical protein
MINSKLAYFEHNFELCQFKPSPPNQYFKSTKGFVVSYLYLLYNYSITVIIRKTKLFQIVFVFGYYLQFGSQQCKSFMQTSNNLQLTFEKFNFFF